MQRSERRYRDPAPKVLATVAVRGGLLPRLTPHMCLPGQSHLPGSMPICDNPVCADDCFEVYISRKVHGCDEAISHCT